MRRRVDNRPRARADLLDIWLYVASDNEPAADRLLARIADVCDMLCDQPNAGRARPELGVSGLRSFPVGRFVIYYQSDKDAVTVIRVLEGHRDIEAVFDRDERES